MYIISIIMKKSVHLFPRLKREMSALGERLKLARKRRRISAVLLAERAGISRATLLKIEKGDPSVAMGNYAAVLSVLGLSEDLGRLAVDDVLGRRMQDAELLGADSGGRVRG